jgi:hypothetical protein
VVDAANNKVGIGTATPNQTLTIGATNGYPVVDFENSNVAYGDIGYQVDKMVLSAYTTTPLTFWTNSNERVRITSAGLVGIGTSAPTAKLQVRVAADANIGLNDDGGVARISCFNDAVTAGLPIIIQGDNIRFSPLGTERGRFTSNGLTFNGDTAAANALDDYEEGTWTIGVEFGGASVGVTTANSSGTYTKIGRQVTVNGYLALTNKGSSTGDALITGLPFTVANTVGNYSAASFWLGQITFNTQIFGILDINTTKIGLFEILGATGVRTTITNADFANNTDVIISATYFV